MLGAVSALAALTRGEALLLLPLVLIPVVVRRPGGVRAAAVVAVVAFAVVLAPWTVRNWIVFDQPVAIATNSGTAVAGANCAETYQRRPARRLVPALHPASTRARTRRSTTRRRCATA